LCHRSNQRRHFFCPYITPFGNATSSSTLGKNLNRLYRYYHRFQLYFQVALLGINLHNQNLFFLITSPINFGRHLQTHYTPKKATASIEKRRTSPQCLSLVFHASSSTSCTEVTLYYVSFYYSVVGEGSSSNQLPLLDHLPQQRHPHLQSKSMRLNFGRNALEKTSKMDHQRPPA